MQKRFGIILVVMLLAATAWGVVKWAGRRPPVQESNISILSTSASSTTQPACCTILPKRFATTSDAAHPGMHWIPGGEFTMGSDTAESRPDERPLHKIRVDGFWMDQTDVTNAQFRKFVEATGYVTTAERKPDWEELKKQLSPGTPKPPEDKLVPASIVFTPTSGPVPLNDYSQWWNWVPGADWKHPNGPGSNIDGKDDFPVVQVSWDDAVVFAKWAGKQLPTEAQWEFAARGGLEGKKYWWGDEDPTDQGPFHCNIWQGHFPDRNTAADGYAGPSPVHAFKPNGYGLYDMAGNVWQWCSDWYRADTYAMEAHGGPSANPSGPADSFDPEEPYTPKHVIRGGSFLCNACYCSSYRVAARMKSTPDSSTNHTGFRCVIAEK